MLVLTRHTSRIMPTGNDIAVRILGLKRRRFLLGINVPNDVPTHREELWRQITSVREVS